MIKRIDKETVRKARHKKIRQHLSGTIERPRFDVYRSDKNIYVQIVDDVARNTLVACSTLEPDIKQKIEGLDKSGAAKVVGAEAAKRALEKGITEVVFDRGGYVYIGRVAKVADGAREAGLKF